MKVQMEEELKNTRSSLSLLVVVDNPTSVVDLHPSVRRRQTAMPPRPLPYLALPTQVSLSNFDPPIQTDAQDHSKQNKKAADIMSDREA
jgi:hypothetical protein